ncbi:putative serine protease K12H4.7 [Trichogramma pretiosum]|uniref:putative serine protease K12H4.7 n=1 Tax=Trichogramma pretiosum TaxID=7493 RepID=UPI0006C97100|nr:putative serine protease K12H4.7 [Trichogramma pretiosum]XP_014233689.1 putative serine protease K12H4.7 [Trichogramma pretiosum]
MRFAVLLLVVCFIYDAAARRRFSRHHGLGSPKLSKVYDLPKDQWFEQHLDHSNPTDGRMWKQRYFMNGEYYKEGGPIFLLIGGEGPAEAKWLVEGEMIDNAKKYGAMCFQLEHRYYGKSHPTQDMSVKNLVYLSSEQALADLAYFIEAMPKMYNMTQNSKWIVFGGSYPGSLAAWMRYKYPHLVHGAVSASGPLLAQADFQQYFIVVEESLRTHSQGCIDAIGAAMKQVHIMLRHRIGQQSLAKLFKFCDPIDSGKTTTKDIANLYESLADTFADVVQYNKDNRNSSVYTIDDICNVLVDEKRGVPVNRFAEVSNMLLKKNKEECLDYKYSKMIDEMRNVTWPGNEAPGGRQWTYQTCTEFGFFQTSTARPNLFSETFPVDFYLTMCQDIFGPRFLHTVEIGVERTNTIYGALDLPNVISNVVFVHGSIDPWHALGVTKSNNPEAPAIFINGTAHCANMYPPSKKDLPQLTQARKQISNYIGQWLEKKVYW